MRVQSAMIQSRLRLGRYAHTEQVELKPQVDSEVKDEDANHGRRKQRRPGPY